MMNVFEKNMKALKETRPEIYNKLVEETDRADNILEGTALNGEPFLVIQEGEQIIAFDSNYHPDHAAERFVAQFEENKDDSRIFVFGFGSGSVIRKILSERCPIQFCIIYEPSKEMFIRVMETFDIEDILRNRDMVLAIHDVNDEEFERFMVEIMDFQTWRTYTFVSLYQYRNYYLEEYKKILDIYIKTLNRKETEMNTLIHFAESGMENEIKALKWMIDCQAFEDFVDKFPKDLPCIVVAAGPSLEKNVELLRDAKGKALIICVDTAIHFLLDRGIYPDLACTIDSKKGTTYFTDPRTHDIPMLVALQSDYHSLEMIGDVKPIYLSAENEYYHTLFDEKGKRMAWFDGGGSVATVCFQGMLNLGFKKVILIGQDLAFSDNKSHAGQALLDSDFSYKTMMVEGYYGGEVLTRADFNSYIEWYGMVISENKDRTIINATEGGAKLKGAIQMSLREALDNYCKEEYDVTGIIDSIPHVWETYEEKRSYYTNVKDKIKSFQTDITKLKRGIDAADRAITLIKRKNYDERELKKLESIMSNVTDHMMAADEILILIKRIIKWDLEISGELHNFEDEVDKESLRLYIDIYDYYTHLKESIEELLPIWIQTVEDINSKYHFE